MKFSKSFFFTIGITIIFGIFFVISVYRFSGGHSSDVRGIDAVYTVRKMTEICNQNECKWKVVYSEHDLDKVTIVDNKVFDVGDKVYERLICRRVGGKDHGKVYDPRFQSDTCSRAINPRFGLFSSLENINKSCGGWCDFEFQGKYQEQKQE